LLLAWLNILISEERYAQPFGAEWTEGFDQLAVHLAGFTPEWAAPITNLPPDLIRETARVMAASTGSTNCH
jgi:thiosulfate reductase/polysulfide reductase chain A